MERMLKIATVDDMREARENLAENIKHYMDERGLKYQFFQYTSGEAFVAALERESFDIVFMDIFMDGMTGIDAAGKLRERDMDCKLVFLTTSKDFLEDGYAYNPCHYLVKPYHAEKFERAMYNCQIKQQLDVPFLAIVSDGVPLRIDTTELIYVDTCERIVQLHTTTRTLPVGRGFSGIAEPLLADKRFLQCIKGVLVNMDFIAAAEETVFVMKNGERLQMAMRERKNLIKQYRAYQFERAQDMGRNCL